MDSVKLKESWMFQTVDYFKPLTFGELQVGDRFIALPCPGDNEGHGGFRQSYNLFTKTKMEIKEAASGLPYGIPHGEAVDDRGVKSGQPYSMPVIKVNVSNMISSSVTVFTLADGVGTTKIVGPFPNREAANQWRNEFWDLFGKRFGEDRIVPIDTIRTFEPGDQLISPEEFIETIPDQQSEAEFFL